ncbi:MAG TPA: HlyD family efflux transporter periplasmic adaptor subunit [Chitinophagaceae bacterium]|nr:HlyD family efflux transporter periplasmic adaptor subunit [Chitinophagaceae bacterium]
MENNNNNNNGSAHKPEEVEEIDFRSEEVGEILTAMPHWTIRSGSGYLLLLIVLALIISWFIKYPTIIKASATLTSTSPPIDMIAKSSGYVTLLVQDNEPIAIGQTIGYLSSSVNAGDMLSLKGKLDSFKTAFYSNPALIENYKFTEKVNFGEFQAAYNQLKKTLGNYQFFIQQKSHAQRASLLRAQISKGGQLARQMQAENVIKQNELQLSKQAFERDSILYTEKVIAKSEYEAKKKEYLSNVRNYQNALSGLTARQIDSIELYGRINDLQLEGQKQHDELLTQIEVAMNELDAKVKQWEELYLIKSPIEGKLALFSYWANNQFIESGQEIASVIPGNKDYIVRAKVPVAGSGKIKLGQKANIKLDNYPFNEYGMLNGKVKAVSLIPKENNYNVLVEIPPHLVTTYNKRIDFKQEMSGQVEIITDDIRFLDRCFYQFRQLVNSK